MKIELVQKTLAGQESAAYISCLPGEGQVSGEQEALELVGACGENGTRLLLLQEGALSEDFFRLRTGVAGAVMLKFSTYRLRVAAVISPEWVRRGKFEDMVLETNRGDQFRVFSTPEQAEAWLLS